ncbi:MAG TPA: LamG domain-containing protein [Gemmataceae bacterium]|nr:LamG domain-containing protein [Gemmataceae bacterium]
MGRSFNGSSDFAKFAGAITARPMSMACWFYTGSIAANQCLMFEGDDGFNHEQMMYLNTSQKLVGADRSNSATTTASYTLNAWQHAAVTFGAADTVQIFLNGANKIANAAGAGTQLNSYFQLGQLSNSGIWWMNGRIAEAAVWNVVLTDAEIAALATGVMPYRIRPASLKAYWPLWGLASPEVDLSGLKQNLTLTGTGQGNHATVTPFTRKIQTRPDLIAGGAQPMPWPILAGRAA